MEVDVEPVPRRKKVTGRHILYEVPLLAGASFGMCIWWAICVVLLHPLCHAPVLSGAVKWEYRHTRQYWGYWVEDLALPLGCFLPVVLVMLIAGTWLRMPWWAWVGTTVLLGSCLGTLTYLSNPNYMGIEYAAFVQGGWLWACGLGFFFRWVVRALKIG